MLIQKKLFWLCTCICTLFLFVSAARYEVTYRPNATPIIVEKNQVVDLNRVKHLWSSNAKFEDLKLKAGFYPSDTIPSWSVESGPGIISGNSLRFIDVGLVALKVKKEEYDLKVDFWSITTMALTFGLLQLYDKKTSTEYFFIKVEPPLIPVTDIIEVTNSAIVGIPLDLTGIPIPENATNKTIKWKVKYGHGEIIPGTTNKLRATAAGKITVTAEIIDGEAIGKPYTRDFDITVLQPVADITPVEKIISGVPQIITINTPIVLNAMVIPSNATNQKIEWSVAPGITGAELKNNVLTAKAAGPMIAIATITDGKGIGQEFTGYFEITVKQPPPPPVINVNPPGPSSGKDQTKYIGGDQRFGSIGNLVPGQNALQKEIDWSDPYFHITANYTVGNATKLNKWGIFHIPNLIEQSNIIKIANALEIVRKSYNGHLPVWVWIRPDTVNPGIQDTSSGKIIRDSGNQYLDGDYNSFSNGAAGSMHIHGFAVDIINGNKSLSKFLLENQQLLEDNGLWMEDEKYSSGLIHLDSSPAKPVNIVDEENKKRIYAPKSPDKEEIYE